MKASTRWTMGIALILSLGLGRVDAQAAELGIFGSEWSPEDGDETFGAGAKVRGGVGPFYLSLRGAYYDDITESDGIELQVIPADAGVGLQMDFLSSVEIYGGGGATYYFMDVKDGSVDDEVGWYLEAGVELTIAEHVCVFGEIVWRHVEGTVEDDDITTDRVDVELKGPGVNVGLVFR